MRSVINAGLRAPYQELISLLCRNSTRVAILEALTEEYQTIPEIARQADTDIVYARFYLNSLAGAGAVEVQERAPRRIHRGYRLTATTAAGRLAICLAATARALEGGSVA